MAFSNDLSAWKIRFRFPVPDEWQLISVAPIRVKQVAVLHTRYYSSVLEYFRANHHYVIINHAYVDNLLNYFIFIDNGAFFWIMSNLKLNYTVLLRGNIANCLAMGSSGPINFKNYNDGSNYLKYNVPIRAILGEHNKNISPYSTIKTTNFLNKLLSISNI